MNTVIKVSRFLFKYKYRASFSIIFMLAYSLFTVAPAHYSKAVMDYLIEAVKMDKTIEISRFVLVGAALMLILVLKGISFFLQNYLMGSLTQKTVRNMREKLYDKILSMPIGFFNKQPSGELISRFTVDFVTLNEAIVIGLVGPLRDMPTIIFLFVIMFDRSWQLMLMTLILLPIVSKLISIFGQQSNKATSKRLNQFGSLSTLLSETITGIRVVKAFIMEKHEFERFKKENRNLYKHFLESIFISSYSYPLLEITAGFFAVFVLAYGGHLIANNQITFGDFTSFIMSFMMLNTPIKQMNGISLKIQEGIAAADRVFDILESDWKIEEAENAKPLAPIQKEICVQINHFAYDDTTVLKDIKLKLKAGTITALVGSSGSGKTTFANLLPRFYDVPDDGGSIKIDGVDIREVSLKTLRNQIATVSQDIVLFNDSIRNNISYGKQDCSEEKLIEAATAGYAHDFIMGLPNQYEQQIGEKGVMLSGGQRQRIAISRALIKDAPILILDEATSALDTESEKEVQAAIENLMRNRTTLVIAHRLSTIKHADVIHVLRNGRIIESGNHKELIDQNGEYKRLYDLQFKDPC
jgi:ATP-binding cassette, subfamily B, bacterial MsbA